MDTRFAFLCDSANQGGGKLNALGLGWDTIRVQKVPATHPTLCVVAKFEFHVSEAGTKQVAIRLMDADGGDVIPAMQGKLEVRPPSGSGPVITVEFVMSLNGIRFQSFGDYSVHIVVDGTEVSRLPFKVVQAIPSAS